MKMVLRLLGVCSPLPLLGVIGLAVVLSACTTSRGGGSGDAATADDSLGPGAADVVAADLAEPDAATTLGLGCSCSPGDACSQGFCSDFSVCTSNDPQECASDADCACNARCVVVGGTQSCQVPCATTSDCPGTLQCGAPTQPWTTTTGDTLPLACLAQAVQRPVTWDQDIAPLVGQRCAPCHVGGGSSGGASFDSYAPTQVTVTDCGTASTLAALMAAKVSAAPPCGSRMPLGGGPLADNEIQLLVDWVAAGAPER